MRIDIRTVNKREKLFTYLIESQSWSKSGQLKFQVRSVAAILPFGSLSLSEGMLLVALN